MKKLLFMIMSLFIASSCMSTKDSLSMKKELREEKKLADQEEIKVAVESRRFIIKLDKIYPTRGGMVDLRPQYNYIIIDGKKAIISAAYLGRQFDVKPIAGINMQGIANNYESSDISSRGLYEIKMKINNESNSFQVFLRVDKNGSCNVSLSSLMIDYVSYRGHIVPIKDKNNIPVQTGVMI